MSAEIISLALIFESFMAWLKIISVWSEFLGHKYSLRASPLKVKEGFISQTIPVKLLFLSNTTVTVGWREMVLEIVSFIKN